MEITEEEQKECVKWWMMLVKPVQTNSENSHPPNHQLNHQNFPLMLLIKTNTEFALGQLNPLPAHSLKVLPIVLHANKHVLWTMFTCFFWNCDLLKDSISIKKTIQRWGDCSISLMSLYKQKKIIHTWLYN